MRSRGFTIIEILMVVAILGIFAGLAAPSMADLLAATSIRGASSDLYTSLITARSEAIKRRSNATVAPVGANWNSGWTVTIGGNTFQKVDPLKPRVAVNPTTATPIVYGSNGRAISGGNQTIKFSDSVRTTVANRCVGVGTNGLAYVRQGC